MIEKSGFLIKRYLVFILGLYFLAAGIVLIVHSNLGTTPISSINYVLSVNTPLTLGTWTFIINNIYVIGQFWLVRGIGGKKDIMEILLQVPFSFLFSFFIDLNMRFAERLDPSSYSLSVAVLLIGCFVQAVGVVLEMKPKVVIMSAEGVVKYASRRYDKDFGKLKVALDVTLVTTAIIVSLIMSHRIDGVREGSVIAACITGFIVSFLNNKIITRRNLQRIVHLVR